MTRLVALPIALAGLALAACTHSHPHRHMASGAMVPMPTRTVSFADSGALGDTQTYMPGDSCAGRNAHSSGALVGNAAGGTRYECSGFVTAATPTKTSITTTRTYTAAPTSQYTTTRSYSTPSASSYTYSTQPSYTYSQPGSTHTTRSYTTSPHRSYTYSTQPQTRFDAYEQRQTGTVYSAPHTTYTYSSQHPAPGTMPQRQTYQYIPGVPSTRSYTIPTEPDLKGE